METFAPGGIDRGRWHFQLATPDHESELRRLAQGQALPGWVDVAFEREPDFFRSVDIEGDRRQVVVAIDRASGRMGGFYTRAVRLLFVNGLPRRVGYLSQGRFDPSLARGYRSIPLIRDCMRAGYELSHHPDEAAFDLTAMMSGSETVRRIFSANLEGLLRVRAISGLTTLILRCRTNRVPPGVPIRRAESSDVLRLASYLQARYAEYQFAPHWDDTTLGSDRLCRDLRFGDFLLAERAGQLVGCLALWDQRAFKQMVVRGYRPAVRRLRPLVNVAASALGLPRLPPVGSVARQGWLSHVAGNDAETVTALVAAGLSLGAERGLEAVMAGFADGNPLLHVLRRKFRHLVYRSTLYAMHWPADEAAVDGLGSRPVHVELAAM